MPSNATRRHGAAWCGWGCLRVASCGCWAVWLESGWMNRNALGWGFDHERASKRVGFEHDGWIWGAGDRGD